MVIGALLGMLALLAYLFMGSRNETLEVQKLLTAKVEQFAVTQARLDSISTVLDKKIVEVRQLGGSLVKLQQIRQQLQEDKRRLKYDLTFSLQQYNLKIRDYRQFLAQHEKDLQVLRDENGSLLSRARALEEEKQSILDENQGLKSEKAALARRVSDVSRQNADLQEKVTLASALKAVDVEVLALTGNGRQRTGGVYKASRIDRLLIRFILPANPLTFRNEKEILVRVLDANGAVVSDSGGGVTYYEGHEIGYSTHQRVPYTNNDQQVDIPFRKSTEYKPGIYQIELYAEGFRIGEGRFEVR